MIPNATWRVQVGDKFTFTGITLPEAYVPHGGGVAGGERTQVDAGAFEFAGEV